MDNKIYKTEDYFRYNKISQEFIESLDSYIIKESKENVSKSVIEKVISDLKLNLNLVGVFGSGIGAFYPIVDALIKGINIDANEDTIVLMTVCAMTIIYFEEKKLKQEDQDKIVKDSKYMLEELKLKGVGNGIMKKLVKAFQSIKNIFSIISKHLGAVFGGFVDMFSYTAILIPIMNSIFFVVGKYNMNLDNLIENFLGLSIGVGTIFAKHAMVDVIDRLKTKFSIKKRVLDEIGTPMAKKFGDKTYGLKNEPEMPEGTEIIQEQ